MEDFEKALKNFSTAQVMSGGKNTDAKVPEKYIAAGLADLTRGMQKLSERVEALENPQPSFWSSILQKFGLK